MEDLICHTCTAPIAVRCKCCEEGDSPTIAKHPVRKQSPRNLEIATPPTNGGSQHLHLTHTAPVGRCRGVQV